MTKLQIVLSAALVAASAAAPAAAQTNQMHLGPRIGYNFDAEALTLGGQFSMPLGRFLEFYPSVDVIFVDVGSAWSVNADLKYRLASEGWNWLYVGGGLNITGASGGGQSNTDAGLNLIAGAESLRGKIHPFGELRLTVGGGSMAALVFGLNFTLGNHR